MRGIGAESCDCKEQEVHQWTTSCDGISPYDVIDVVPVDALQTLRWETHRYDVWINV